MKYLVAAIPSLIFGLLFGYIVGWQFNPYATTQEALIDAWRDISPGMHISEVQENLGEQYLHITAGSGWPPYIKDALPEKLAENHDLYAFYIKGWGPQILFVLCDKEGRAVYVGSTYT